MSATYIVYRKTDGKYLPCQDIGCDDPDRAEYNRYIVTNHLFCEGYYFVERALAHIPYNQPLPSWMPIGELPVVGKEYQTRDSGEEDLTDPFVGVV